MGRVKSQGHATGGKAAAKRSELGRQSTERLRAFARLTRLATRLRAAEAAIAEASRVLSDPNADLSEAAEKARQILGGARPASESTTTPTCPAPASTGATVAAASSRPRG